MNNKINLYIYIESIYILNLIKKKLSNRLLKMCARMSIN